MVSMNTDEHWMQRALQLAERAQAAGEVPVGAVLVLEGAVLAETWNRPIGLDDPTAHAEILALREGGARLGNYRLTETTLYVTLEPCSMCVGAMIHARVARLVYAATDPRTGACGGAIDLAGASFHNHRLDVTGGVLAEASAELLRTFFRARR